MGMIVNTGTQINVTGIDWLKFRLDRSDLYLGTNIWKIRSVSLIKPNHARKHTYLFLSSAHWLCQLCYDCILSPKKWTYSNLSEPLLKGSASRPELSVLLSALRQLCPATALTGLCVSKQSMNSKALQTEEVLIKQWVIVKKSSPKNLSADCRSSVGRLSAVCWPTVGRLSVLVDRLSAICRPTDGRQVFPKT